MNRLSKREFEDVLCESESLFIGTSIIPLSDMQLESRVVRSTDSGRDWCGARRVVKRQSNALVFSDGSRLCTDQKNQTFYKGDRFVCRKVSTDDGEYVSYVWYWLV